MRRRPLAAALLAAALVLPACSSSGSDAAPPSTTAPKAAPKPAVEIKGFRFVPTPLRVKAGTAITFTNEDTSTHTATSDSGPGSFDTGDLTTGKSATVTLTEPGTYRYRCSIHNNTMQGTIVVTA